MQEYEFHRAFTKQKDALHSTSYTGLSYGLATQEPGMMIAGGPGSVGGMGMGMSMVGMTPGSTAGHGNMSVFLEDTMMLLKAMESAIAQQEEMLNREDLLLECEFKQLVTNSSLEGDGLNDDDLGADLAPVSASAVNNNKEQEVFSWKLTTHAASLQINKLLCQSLYYAVSNSEGVFISS